MTALHASSTWWDAALCAQIGGNLWFPAKGDSGREAISICHQCPVRQECLDDAIKNLDFDEGIRGGLSPRKRRKYAQQLGAVSRPCHGCYQPLPDGVNNSVRFCNTCRVRRKQAHNRKYQSRKEKTL